MWGRGPNMTKETSFVWRTHHVTWVLSLALLLASCGDDGKSEEVTDLTDMQMDTTDMVEGDLADMTPDEDSVGPDVPDIVQVDMTPPPSCAQQCSNYGDLAAM